MIERAMRVRGSAGTLVIGALLALMTAPIAAQSPSPVPTDPVGTALPSPMALSSPMAAPSLTAATMAVSISLSDFEIAPESVEVSGSSVTFSVTNEGITPHNLSVRDEAGVLVGATPDLSQGESSELEIALAGPGPYTLFCSLAGHESLGMSGVVQLTPGASSEPTADPS